MTQKENASDPSRWWQRFQTIETTASRMLFPIPIFRYHFLGSIMHR